MYSTKSSALASALRAARRGWPVIPVHGFANGKCTCGNPDCAHPAKHPLTTHEIRDATTHRSTIRKWLRKHPNANLGIATGKESGLLVLDIDPRHGGLESLEKFEAEFGQLPDGPQVRTGRGRHLYFRHPVGKVKSKIGVPPGIDVRADGAYVVGAGSLHKSGKPYLWVKNKTPKKTSLPHLPDALLRPLETHSPSPLQPEPVIPEGQRNSTLASLGGSMRSRGMTGQTIEVALLEENRQHCDPPLSDAEVIGII
jgi:hypothetical protein